MNLESHSFKNGEIIPPQYTCDKEGIFPSLFLSNIPEKTQSLALIIEDPDAPRGTYVHFVAWNIPPSPAIAEEGTFPSGIIGVNTAGSRDYQPPCPPTGTHRYFFHAYALSDEISLSPQSGKEELLQAIEGKIVEKAELLGIYKRT